MTEPPRVWKTGERCRITYDGRTVDGAIKLASTNGKSLMLAFEALLGGYVGMMPVSWVGPHVDPHWPGPGFYDLLRELPVTLEETGRP